MSSWRRTRKIGQVGIAVHAHAGWAGRVAPEAFTAFVEKVAVSWVEKNTGLSFMLRDGMEYTVDGVR